MGRYFASKAARLSGVAARTVSKTSDERASPLKRSVRQRNISLKTSISEKTRTLPSLSVKTTPAVPTRSRRFIRPLSPIAAVPILGCLLQRLQGLQAAYELLLLLCLQGGANGPDIGVYRLYGDGRHVRQQLTFE